MNEIDAGDCSGLTMEEIKARSENANLKESCCNSRVSFFTGFPRSFKIETETSSSTG